MKKIFFIALAFATVSLTSCEGFLDVKSEGQYATDNYFTNDEQAAATVNDMYHCLRGEDFYGQNMFWEETAAKTMMAVRLGDAGDYIHTYSIMEYDGNVGTIKSIYNQSYTQMSQANWIIKSLLAKDDLTYIETRTLGEAYFLRGFYHFLIAYRYGCKAKGVPFVAYEDNPEYNYDIPPQLESVTKNFEYVVSDFEKAADLLPSVNEYSDSEKGRACRESALAMAVRANAFWATWDASRWDEVISLVTTLKNEGRALSTLDKIYSDEPADYFNSEYCWGFGGKGGSLYGGSWFPICSMPFGPFDSPINTNTNGWGEFYTSYDLYEEMMKDGADNARMKASVIHTGEHITIYGQDLIVAPQYQDAISTGVYLHKWNRAYAHEDFINAGYVGPSDNASNHMFHVIRFAECLLFRAEAYLVKGKDSEAKADLNAIRERSGLAPISDKVTWTNLYHERRCELCFEAAPYIYNLKRWALSENTSAPDEIRNLALKELTSVARVAVWEKVGDNYTGNISEVKDWTGYGAGTWADYKICFPYPQEELDKAVVDGKKIYTQNPGY